MSIQKVYNQVVKRLEFVNRENERLKSLNKELVEALENITNQTVMTEYNSHCFKQARSALSKAKEQ